MPTDQTHPQGLDFQEMTVASIREVPTADHVEVVFLESARFYRLERSNPDFAQAIRLLRRALAKNGVVRVGLEAPDSDLISEIRER